MNTLDIDNLISILQAMKTNNNNEKPDSIINKIENSDTKKDLNKFQLNDLKKYCKHHEITVSGVKTKYVNAVWKHIEDQYEWYYTDGSDEEPDDDSDYESDDSDESEE